MDKLLNGDVRLFLKTKCDNSTINHSRCMEIEAHKLMMLLPKIAPSAARGLIAQEKNPSHRIILENMYEMLETLNKIGNEHLKEKAKEMKKDLDEQLTWNPDKLSKMISPICSNKDLSTENILKIINSDNFLKDIRKNTAYKQSMGHIDGYGNTHYKTEYINKYYTFTKERAIIIQNILRQLAILLGQKRGELCKKLESLSTQEKINC